jgi:hypothetical protein
MWVFNVFLYMMFLSNPAVYQEFKDSGSPCYVYRSDSGEDPATGAPPCFYDPEEQR